MVEEARFLRWAKAAQVLRDVDPPELGGALSRNAFALGRWDVRLRHADEEQSWTEPDPRWFVSGSHPMDHADHLALSRMWVLDAYELLRTIDGAVRSGAWSPSDPLPADIKLVKQRLAGLRVPLAKYEPAGRSGRAVAGDAVPFPVYIPGRGAGWSLGKSPEMVTRGYLGEQVLELLEAALAASSPDAA